MSNAEKARRLKFENNLDAKSMSKDFVSAWKDAGMSALLHDNVITDFKGENGINQIAKSMYTNFKKQEMPLEEYIGDFKKAIEKQDYSLLTTRYKNIHPFQKTELGKKMALISSFKRSALEGAYEEDTYGSGEVKSGYEDEAGSLEKRFKQERQARQEKLLRIKQLSDPEYNLGFDAANDPLNGRKQKSHFNKDLSLTDERKNKIFARRFNKMLESVDAKSGNSSSMKKAMQAFADKYNLDVNLSGYKTSMMGRVFNRLRNRKNLTEGEALDKLLSAYSRKTDEYIEAMKNDVRTGKISSDQFIRRANVGYTKRAAAIERGETKAASKNLSKLGWKGKAGAAAALLALGGVIGNQFSGGHQSNAQLYNPNPQPQYAN